MDYDLVRWLASRIGHAATQLDEGISPLAGPWGDDSTPPLFGNTGGAVANEAAHAGARTAGISALRRIGVATAADDGRIRQAVSTFQRMDHEAADALVASAGNKLNVFTTHVHSDSRGTLGPHDRERAYQINKAVDAVAAHPGQMVVTGDLNIDYDSDVSRDGVVERSTGSAAAVRRFEDELGFTNAGDGAGPTGSYGNGGQIDYVFTSPDLDTGDARKVEGDPRGDKDLSDHDGIAVDVHIPPAW